MTAATVGRSRALLLVGAPVLVGAVLYAVQGPDLTVDTRFRITTPSDGAAVDEAMTIGWTSARGATGYAVVVDHALPEPGAVVVPGPHVITLSGRQLALRLGPASSGSPSARRVHTVTVVPVDDRGRRSGEHVARVRVRTRP